MPKYSYEEKLEAVRRVIEDGMSAKQSGRILGTSEKPVARWVALYRQFGPEGLLLKHGSYSGEFKISVVEYMHENHLSLTQTAIHFGIPTESTVSKWERIYYEEGSQALYRDNRGRGSKMSSDKPRKKNPDNPAARIRKARRHLEKQGYMLHKSKNKVATSEDFGLFQIREQSTNKIVAGKCYNATLNDIEHFYKEILLLL